MDRAYARLAAAGVEHVSPAPQRLPDWNPAAGGIRAFYFRDPDGHVLEILWFPPGKGDARWRRADRLFLGIDHTAIVVRDTARSLACYRDALGLRVAGTSENWGPEQERLNDVPGARLRITTLRAPEGPGIELLEYLAPRDGRPFPADASAADLAHWHTALVTGDAAALRRALEGGPCAAAPGAPVATPSRELGFARAVAARDPDGHALHVVEP
jgi:catechol 2,3-dioxygenase-like lactoylglutathione lyase family enzyme